MNAYERLCAARKSGRPTARKYIEALCDRFFELHGDRLFADDPAILGGIAELDGMPVTVIGIEKGEDTKEKITRNFGSPNPEGYRKALRLMKQAEKFHRPVLCFVDTAGAYCGLGAEERGQGSAIAQNLVEMMGLKTPVISVLIGEGGSGGALFRCAALQAAQGSGGHGAGSAHLGLTAAFRPRNCCIAREKIAHGAGVKQGGNHGIL